MNLFTKQKQTHRHRKQSYGYQRGRERDKSGAWDDHTHSTIYKIDNQQRPTVEHRELYSIFWDNLYQKRILKRMDICITESLCCTPETNTTL